MKENKYDDPAFFERYSGMARSKEGLTGAGEWHILKELLPDFHGKNMLDLGCGFGWHCRYAIENGAEYALGIDISARMIDGARAKNMLPGIDYRQMAIEDYDYPHSTYQIVLSSLAFHYIECFEEICRRVFDTLTPGGSFVFSVEHPVFTAYGTEDWVYNELGEAAYWPVDNYFSEGPRKTMFLGEEVIKYHKTLTTYMQTLFRCGFTIDQVVEPQPTPEAIRALPQMKEELRRPMMLIISAIRI